MTEAQVPALEFADDDEPVHGRVSVDPDDRIVFLPRVPPGDYDVRLTRSGVWALVPRPVVPGQRPYRVVDRYGRGWLTCHETASTYPSIEGEWTFERIVAERGPVREVVAAPRKDTEELEHVLAVAGRKAAGTVLVALYRVSKHLYDLHGHDELLVAGRPGSWESALLPRLAYEVGASIPTSRVDVGALAVVQSILLLWTKDRPVYVEVAETLAAVFGRVVDGRGGWDQVADQWLRASPYDEEIRNLLTGLSRYFHPGA